MAATRMRPAPRQARHDEAQFATEAMSQHETDIDMVQYGRSGHTVLLLDFLPSEQQLRPVLVGK